MTIRKNMEFPPLKTHIIFPIQSVTHNQECAPIQMLCQKFAFSVYENRRIAMKGLYNKFHMITKSTVGEGAYRG